ncbi:MAG: hypothetical protein FD181_2384 [Prolixibacteraceae bacterium]|nr:MAG: hypothetical protein FD181_2384 [Prolixibacteraceae bacterium]
MKYYIITSSLNVDNILSSESISPISFYGKRDFGYKTFQKIDKLNIANNIVLFSEIPYFEIHDSERENYPMVIEITDDVQLKDKLHYTEQSHSVCQIFLYNQSIRLTPWNCKILFFSQQALVLSKLKCSDSLCNKLSEFYRFELVKPNKSILLKDVLKDSAINEPGFNIDLLVLENKLNRLKGFLYGYNLGFTKSLSDDVAKLLGLQKRIYNIVASIINNKGVSNEHFNEELKKLDYLYNEIDPHKKLSRNLWNEKILSRFTSSADKNTFETILRELFVESEAKLNFCKNNNLIVRKLSYSTPQKYFDWSAYQSELSVYTQSIIYEDKAQRTNIDLSTEFTLPADYSTIRLNDENAKLYNEILSGYFFKDSVITIEDLRLNRLEIATEITKGLKALMQSANKDWENSQERLFFNSLRQNIANSEPFDLQKAPDIINLSIAAFLLKGEDFEALTRYLEENGVSDYKYVLGFWGAACGYVDMPKPNLNPIIKQKESFCQVYKSVDNLLFKSSIEGPFPETSNVFINKSNTEVPLIKENNKSVQPENKFNEIFSAVQKKLGKKINEKQKIAVEKSLNSASTPDKILYYLKKNDIKSTTKIYKEFEAYLSPSVAKNVEIERELFSDSSFLAAVHQSDLSFLMDVNRINNISQLIVGDKNLKQFKTDLEWFVENHRESYLDSKKGFQSGFYYGKSTDNKSVIERFEIYLNNKRENKQKWLSDIYLQIPVEKIIARLKNVYK